MERTCKLPTEMPLFQMGRKPATCLAPAVKIPFDVKGCFLPLSHSLPPIKTHAARGVS